MDHRYYSKINGVISLFYKYAKRGLISGDMKEKYGTIRWYAEIRPIRRLHDITKRGHYYYRYGADDKPFMNFLDNLSMSYLRPFTRLIYQYQKFMYGYAYRQAIRKFPTITEEILASCEHRDLLFKREARVYESIRRQYEDDTDYV